MKSWGETGTDPGQFNIVHNIVTDADGWVYVADRENHRVQVFDGNGKYETQWNNLHRPCALCCCGRGKSPNFIVGELGPGMPVNLKVHQSRPAPHDRGRAGQEGSPGSAARTAPACRPAASSPRMVSRSTPRATSMWAKSASPNWKTSFPDTPMPPEVVRCLQKLEKISA